MTTSSNLTNDYLAMTLYQCLVACSCLNCFCFWFFFYLSCVDTLSLSLCFFHFISLSYGCSDMFILFDFDSVKSESTLLHWWVSLSLYQVVLFSSVGVCTSVIIPFQILAHYIQFEMKRRQTTNQFGHSNAHCNALEMLLFFLSFVDYIRIWCSREHVLIIQTLCLHLYTCIIIHVDCSAFCRICM